jgi:hypothetical protein
MNSLKNNNGEERTLLIILLFLKQHLPEVTFFLLKILNRNSWKIFLF